MYQASKATWNHLVDYKQGCESGKFIAIRVIDFWADHEFAYRCKVSVGLMSSELWTFTLCELNFLHSRQTQYEPILTSQKAPWLMTSHNWFQYRFRELAKIFGWIEAENYVNNAYSHSPGVFLIFHLFLAQNGSSKTIIFLLGWWIQGNSSQVTWHIGSWHTLKRVPWWELTFPIPKGSFLSNLLERLLVFPEQGIRLS